MTDILPNSRAKEDKEIKHHHWLGNVVPLYCANCGASGGYVPIDGPPFAFWLCNDCVTKHGVPAAMMCKPDETYWHELAEEQRYRELKAKQEDKCIIEP